MVMVAIKYGILNHKAFTLIELLVVVAIIGILAAVGVTTLTGFRRRLIKTKNKTIKKLVNL